MTLQFYDYGPDRDIHCEMYPWDLAMVDVKTHHFSNEPMLKKNYTYNVTFLDPTPELDLEVQGILTWYQWYQALGGIAQFVTEWGFIRQWTSDGLRSFEFDIIDRGFEKPVGMGQYRIVNKPFQGQKTFESRDEGVIIHNSRE